jgi:uncharacterized membrane protein YeaQ/YmgE (transglycosylase-associated protein family)
MKKFSDDTIVLTEEQKVAVETLSDKIVELIKEGKSTDEILNGDLDEGLLGGIIGGVAGAAIGPALGRAICKALGIEHGILYNFLNSRAFLAAVCGYVGLKY